MGFNEGLRTQANQLDSRTCRRLRREESWNVSDMTQVGTCSCSYSQQVACFEREEHQPKPQQELLHVAWIHSLAHLQAARTGCRLSRLARKGDWRKMSLQLRVTNSFRPRWVAAHHLLFALPYIASPDPPLQIACHGSCQQGTLLKVTATGLNIQFNL